MKQQKKDNRDFTKNKFFYKREDENIQNLQEKLNQILHSVYLRDSTVRQFLWVILGDAAK